MRIGLRILLFAVGLIVPTCTIVKHIEFNQQCGGYLKQAADANTVELALERLNIAIDYAESHNLTKGYTSILWKTENDNIGFWYQNLIACRSELESAIGSSQLEQTNLLMKVRESLTDNGEEGTTLNLPSGISRYPSNAAFAFGNTVSAIFIGLAIL